MLKTTIALFALLLMIPASASAASTAKYTPRDYFNGQEEEPDEFDPAAIEVTGDAGINTITLVLSGKTVTVADASGLTAAAGCTQVSPTSATCPKPDRSFVSALDGDDHVDAQPSLATEVEGGPGADVVTTAGDIRGGDGPDVLTGTGDGVTIDGEAGDDQLVGGAGDETMFGGPGKDALQGGDGDDLLDGDDPAISVFENDTVDGGGGTDTLAWSSRTVAVTVNLADPGPDGAAGEADQLSSIERLTTGSGADTLTGTDADEYFDSGEGRDKVSGGGGRDFAESSLGSDSFDLGAGSDTISFAGSEKPVTVNLSDSAPDGPKGALDTLAGVENVIGSEPQDDFKGDTLIGDDGPNTLIGILGSDRISGRGGNDKLYGEGPPSVVDSSPSDGSTLELTYPAIDKLSGGAGKDLLVGGIDSDRLDGGLGDDRLVGDSGPGFRDREGKSAEARDVVVYSSRSARIRAGTASGGGQAGEHDTYSGIEGIRGGSGNDVLLGKRGLADLLFGGRGNDRLNGLTGRDTLRGEAGRDTLSARDRQRDVVDCGSSRDSYRADKKDRVKSCERRR